MIHSRYSPEDWEATLIACHYHPKHIAELQQLRDDMHDYELHVNRQQRVNKNHEIPEKPDVTMRLVKIVGDDVAPHQFSREESALEAICRACNLDVATIQDSLR